MDTNQDFFVQKKIIIKKLFWTVFHLAQTRSRNPKWAQRRQYIARHFSNWPWSWREALLQVLLASRQHHGKGQKCNLQENVRPLCHAPLPNAWNKSVWPTLFQHHHSHGSATRQPMLDLHQLAEGTELLVHFLQALATYYPHWIQSRSTSAA